MIISKGKKKLALKRRRVFVAKSSYLLNKETPLALQSNRCLAEQGKGNRSFFPHPLAAAKQGMQIRPLRCRALLVALQRQSLY